MTVFNSPMFYNNNNNNNNSNNKAFQTWFLEVDFLKIPRKSNRRRSRRSQMQKSIWKIKAKLIKKETTLQTLQANTESFQVNMRTLCIKIFRIAAVTSLIMPVTSCSVMIVFHVQNNIQPRCNEVFKELLQYCLFHNIITASGLVT